MQICFRDNTERLYAEFKDEDFNMSPVSGAITVNIQYENGNYITHNAVPVSSSTPGVYFYEFTPDANWKYGYYGVWWYVDGKTVQDIPNPFKLEDSREAIFKAKFHEGIRSKLYMHLDAGGFINKFPRNRELLDLMQNSLNWINGHPPILTTFNFINLPMHFHYLLEMGTVILALQSVGIYEAGKHYVYSDNGIAMTRDRSGKYMQLYGAIMQQYAELLKTTKLSFAMHNVQLKGVFSSTTGYPRSLSRALRGVSKFSS